MRAKFKLLIISCLWWGFSSAQDTLFLLNHDTIIAKVLAINPQEIKYKKYNNLKGPLYHTPISTVNRIKYPNGSEDFFHSLIPLSKFEGKRATITTTSNEKFEIFLKDIKDNKISFRKKDNLTGPLYFLSLDNVQEIRYEDGKVESFTKIPYSKKKETKSKSKEIVVAGRSYYINNIRYTSRQINKVLLSANNEKINELVAESNKIKSLSNALLYSSIGTTIISVSLAFINLIAWQSSEDYRYLIFSGWGGGATLFTVVGGGSLTSVYNDRIKKAISLYNKQIKLNK